VTASTEEDVKIFVYSGLPLNGNSFSRWLLAVVRGPSKLTTVKSSFSKTSLTFFKK